ncbi:MAG: monovalent cation/H+ antiporter subunit D [Steroidobacteraceae bacterium]|nr:monovalent cation/H+ antiporter subunit D [Steroidobacteraceae bacterium]
MTGWLHHLPAVPVVAPLLAGALVLLTPERRRMLRVGLALSSVAVQAVVAAVLLYLTTDAMPDMWTEGVGVYAIGGWPPPFGIALAVDRLAALMLLLSALVALAALTYSLANWDRVGPGFHSIFQFLLMGLNGAFLTSDLFNLFVFFEILLASSYGLLLHGSGPERVRTGLHYIAVNLTASFLFLVGVAMIYGITGTLNMADLPARVALLAVHDRSLFESGAALLGIAFLIKAGIWPLNFWLPTAYAAASAPVAAVFALLTKVGVYAVLRVGTLLASADASTSFIDVGLFYGGMATVAYGVVGMLAGQQLSRLAAYSVVVSSGLLLATLGLQDQTLTAPLLFYLLSSVLGTAAFFLLNGMTERMRLTPMTQAPDVGPLPDETYAGFEANEPPDPHSPDDEIGVAIPAAMAFLGLGFVSCVLLVAGLPPLSGFIAKFALLHGVVATAAGTLPQWQSRVMVVAILVAGLAAVIGMSRIGLRLFWSVVGRTTPRLRLIEAGPVAVLLVLSILLTAGAAPVMVYLDSAARSLHSPDVYIRVVNSALLPGAAR